MGYKTVTYILIGLFLLQPTHGWLYTIAGAAVGAAAAPFVAPVALGALGFGSAGIAAGSIGASWMAGYGGTVAAGSALAVAQSAGAAGIGLGGTLVGAAFGAVTGYATMEEKCPND